MKTYIAERIGYGPVSSLVLVYYEPPKAVRAADVEGVLSDDGFDMPFTAQCVPMELDPDEMIPPLLEEARAIYDADEQPDGNKGCSDCASMQRLIDLLRGSLSV